MHASVWNCDLVRLLILNFKEVWKIFDGDCWSGGDHVKRLLAVSGSQGSGLDSLLVGPQSRKSHQKSASLHLCLLDIQWISAGDADWYEATNSSPIRWQYRHAPGCRYHCHCHCQSQTIRTHPLGYCSITHHHFASRCYHCANRYDPPSL